MILHAIPQIGDEDFPGGVPSFTATVCLNSAQGLSARFYTIQLSDPIKTSTLAKYEVKAGMKEEKNRVNLKSKIPYYLAIDKRIWFDLLCLALDLLDSELSVFMRQLRAQGAAGEPGLV